MLHGFLIREKEFSTEWEVNLSMKSNALRLTLGTNFCYISQRCFFHSSTIETYLQAGVLIFLTAEILVSSHVRGGGGVMSCLEMSFAVYLVFPYALLPIKLRQVAELHAKLCFSLLVLKCSLRTNLTQVLAYNLENIASVIPLISNPVNPLISWRPSYQTFKPYFITPLHIFS